LARFHAVDLGAVHQGVSANAGVLRITVRKITYRVMAAPWGTGRG
jgi:hypothetical protein